MYKIGELSRICHIPVKTLRYYDSEGLLIPDEIDSFTGYRYYSAAKLSDCNRIIALKELGFSLDEIKKHISANNSEDVLALIETKLSELTEKSKEISLQIKKLNRIKKTLSDRIMFPMTIRSGDTIRVAIKRKIYTTKMDAETTIEQIKTTLPKQSLGKRTVIINYEIEYRENNFDLATCVEVSGKVPNSLEFERKTLDFSSEFATLVCKREQLENGYHDMLSQIQEANYQIIGASYEIYYEDGTVELKIPVCQKVKYIDSPIEKKLFENDEAAVGKWEILDVVINKEQFVYGQSKCPDVKNSVWNELYFPESGEPYWFLQGWTKGLLYLTATIPEPHIVASPYSIECLNGHTIMFLEIPRRYEDGSRDAVPQLLVFEKVSNQSFLAKDIKISNIS